MKRLVLLTLILIPSAIHAIGDMSSAGKPPVTIGPRNGQPRPEERATVGESESAATVLTIRHLPSATPERAREEARQALLRSLHDWLAPAGVPEGWSPPEELLRSMVEFGPLEISDRDYGTIYVQPVTLDVSEPHRRRMIESYERELAGQRLFQLAGFIAFVLTCLAAVACYIHADEATLGYYTNTLRVGALAFVGAAGAALYYVLG